MSAVHRAATGHHWPPANTDHHRPPATGHLPWCPLTPALVSPDTCPGVRLTPAPVPPGSLRAHAPSMMLDILAPGD